MTLHPTQRFISGVAFTLIAGSALAQTTRVTGLVSDAATGEPLPFVSVAFVDSRIATTTDIDGHYAFDTYYATDSLRATSVGYLSLTRGVKRDAAQTIDFALETSRAELPEVVVTYKENSAFAILRQVIRNKNVNNRAKLAAYEYENYNKVEFDLNNITEEFKKKKLFKDLEFIFEYVDTTTRKPSLPIFMTETVSDVYYRQEPRTRREIIKGNRVSGVENESITQFMGDMYQNVNIYENYLELFGKNFTSPIADGGKAHYDYLLVDSNWVGRNWCYLIRFKPKHRQQLCFTGEMWINDTSFAVRRIEGGIEPGTNVNFVQELRVRQEYEEVAREVWMLTRDELLVDLNPVRDTGEVSKRPLQGFYGRRTATYRDFVINKPRDDAFYRGMSEVVVETDPLSLGADWWDTHRHEQLSKRENDIYHMVDTMRTVPRFKTYLDIITTVVSGYYVTGPVEIGPYFNIFSFNPVEGPRFRLGARTSNAFSRRVEYQGFLAYGLKDHEFKYGLGGQGFITKEPRQLLGVNYSHDIEQLGQSTNAFRQDNLFSSAFRRTPNNKLTMVDEFRLSYEREWFQGFTTTVLMRYRTLYPRGDLEYKRLQEPLSLGPVTVHSIRNAEIAINTRFAFREKYVSGTFRRVSLGTSWPVVELHAAYGIPRLLHSDNEYLKMVLLFSHRVTTGALGNFRYALEGGGIRGTLPYPLLILHPGNETFYYDDGAYNTMNYFEFISDRYASLWVEQHFDGYFLNRIPLLRRLKWREVVGAKALVGDLDDRHQEALLLLDLMSKLNGAPFVEASAGIENIFKCLRVDGIWRLTHRDAPRATNFALRMKLILNF